MLTETLVCFLPGRAKDLSAPLYDYVTQSWAVIWLQTRTFSPTCTVRWSKWHILKYWIYSSMQSSV